MPTTIDDFYNVLVAFRDGDPNGNGLADEIPLSGSIGSELVRSTLDYFLMNSFQYSTGFEKFWLYLEGANSDTVACSAVQPGWRDALRWYKKLYDEGLMDSEIFINTRESMQALSGAPGGSRLGAFTAMFAVAGVNTDNPEFYDYVAMSPLEGPNGRVSMDVPQGSAGFSYLITHSNPYPEASFRMGDYLMTIGTSGGNYEHMVMRYGLEGVGWKRPEPGELGLDGRPALFRVLPGKPGSDGVNTLTDCRWYEIGPNVRPTDERNAIAVDLGVDYNIEQVLFDETRDMYEPFRVKRALPILVFDAADIEVLTDIQVNIQNYGQEAMAAFVTGSMNIDNDWDSYVQTMNSMGLQTLVEINQRTYDAFMAAQ